MNVRLLFMLLMALLFIGGANANDVYIAPTATGGGTGANCSNALASSYFNTAGNWTSGVPSGVQIGPGTTVHICSGTYGSGSLTAGSGLLVFQGSGSSGNPVTLIADQGVATIQATFIGSNTAGIMTNGKNFTVIDGGCTHATTGYGCTSGTGLLIKTTANGTALANHQDGGNGVLMKGGHDNTLQNISIGPIYVHTCTLTNTPPNYAQNCTDTVGGATGVVSAQGSNQLIQWISGTDAKDCLGLNYSLGGTVSSITAHNNFCQNMDHGMEFGITGIGSSASGLAIYSNHFNRFQNWDTSNSLNTFHHDCTHIFYSGGGSVTGTNYIASNLCDGDFGFNFNSSFFNEPISGTAPIVYFNNISNDQTPTFPHAGGCGYHCAENNNVAFYNETVITSAVTSADCFNMYGTNDVGENNICIRTASGTHVEGGASVSTWDFNTYYLIGGNGWGNFGSFAGWQGAGHDTHGQNGQNPNLNVTTLQPPIGSPVVGFATNLTSLCSTYALLCSDQQGNARPASGNWDGGALNASRALTLSPVPLSFGNQITGTTSVAQTLTVTNSGSAPVTLSSPYFTPSGTNPSDFANTGAGTCSNGATISGGGNCTVTFTFTPGAVGTRTAVVSINAGAQSVTGSLTGVGVAATVVPGAPGKVLFTFSTYCTMTLYCEQCMGADTQTWYINCPSPIALTPSTTFPVVTFNPTMP